jgi:uncharacterized membrane protein YccC
MIHLSKNAKEAIKTALAFTLTYYIALKVAWLNPYWAVITVAMIALPTAGQSIQKGFNRLLGTVPACLVAFVIMGVAPQNRWLFIALACAWILFTTYMMLGSKSHGYMWNVMGFVCLIILLTGPSSSASVFQHAVFRTLETMLGIVVYTLVTVFLWPNTNAGAIRKAAGALVATQADLFRAARAATMGQDAKAQLQELHAQEVQQLGQYAKALQAEGSESWEVHEVRPLLERLHGESGGVMETLDRWQSGIGELASIDMNAVLPGLQAYFVELDERFEEILRLLDGKPAERERPTVSLRIDDDAVSQLSQLDRAALAVTKKELEKLESLTASMLRCVRALAGESAGTTAPLPAPSDEPSTRHGWIPVIDLDHLQSAVFAAMTVGALFLFWIFVNPPGHAAWYQFGGSVAMGIAAVPQVRLFIIVKPFVVAFAIGLAAYVFIMPQLSSFLGLGVLLFVCMFISRYFFSGIGQLAGSMAILNMMSVQNHQTYNFAAMANSYLFTVGALVVVFAFTYLRQSPRPEKAVLRLLRRFFRYAGRLIADITIDGKGERTFLQRWRAEFYRRELRALPGKIGLWGKFINHKHFPDISPEEVQGLVTSLQTLVYRLEELREAGDVPHAESLIRAMGEDLRVWRTGVEATFGRWSNIDERESTEALRERLTTWRAGLEKRIGEVFQQAGAETISGRDAENFFRLLGGVRGVSEATVIYAGVAGTIDLAHWREEVFS